MRSGNEKHAADTWCLGKGFEAAWTHFRPSKPCVSLSTDGIKDRKHPKYSTGAAISQQTLKRFLDE